MENSHKKLLVIANCSYLKLFEVVGEEIVKTIFQMSLVNKSHVRELHEGKFKKGFGQAHFFDPHSSATDIMNREASHLILKQVTSTIHADLSYKEVIFSTEPKLLGHIRKLLTKELKAMVSKEMTKDLIHAEKEAIQKAIFSQT